jgi:hypothetical protein
MLLCCPDAHYQWLSMSVVVNVIRQGMFAAAVDAPIAWLIAFLLLFVLGA